MFIIELNKCDVTVPGALPSTYFGSGFNWVSGFGLDLDPDQDRLKLSPKKEKRKKFYA
jgi:hypothetical protein